MNTTLSRNGEKESQRMLHGQDLEAVPAVPPPLNSGVNQQGTRGIAQKLFLGVVAAAAIVGLLLFQRSRVRAELTTTTLALAVPSVTTTTPTAEQAETEIVLPGNLTAYSEAPIYARTNGYVKAWYTDIGAKVKAGDLMAELGAPDVDAQLRQTNANLSQARANLEIAKLDFGREQDLLKKNVISQEEFDQSRTNLEAMEAAMHSAEAAVQNLAVQQGFQKITAPFDGVDTVRNTDVGSLIAGNGNASNSGQELFHVARTDILRVYIQVPQAYSQLVRVDTPAWLELTELPGEKFQGKVANIAGAINPTTRTLMTEVQVPNADGRLFPGAYASVHLVLKLEKVLHKIPVNTVIFRNQYPQVAVVDAANVAHLRDITLGRDFGTSLEVLDGVASNDRLIVNPSDSLAEGAKVDVQK